MNILVAIKRVVDYHVTVHVKDDQSGVDSQHAKMSMNPFDAIAVEQAIQLKEQGHAEQVTVVSIGSEKSQETLRQALAMGADSAILITTDQSLEPLNIAKILKHISQDQTPSIIITGKQAIDNDCNQTGQMLASLLGWPQATFISSLSYQDQKLLLEREIDEGIETIRVSLPCVLTTDLRLNEPRFAKLPDIVKAKKKPLVITPLDKLELELRSHQTVLQYESPATRPPGKVLEDINELVAILKEQGGAS